MGQLIKFQLRRLNGYSWSVIVVFISATFAMQYHTVGFSLENFFLTLPLIILSVYWSEQSTTLIKNGELTKKREFKRDLFLISFSFLLAGLLSLLLQYNNSDARGWWPVFVYFISFSGVVFALIFSFIAMMVPQHRAYTIIFSAIIIGLFSCSKLWSYPISVVYIGQIDSFWVVFSLLMCLHLLYFTSLKLIKCTRSI